MVMQIATQHIKKLNHPGRDRAKGDGERVKGSKIPVMTIPKANMTTKVDFSTIFCWQTVALLRSVCGIRDSRDYAHHAKLP